MKKKLNTFSIRDRLLSLFVALAMLTGIFVGFVPSSDVSAASHITIIDENTEIEYKEDKNMVVYTKVHKLAESNIRYYTKYFVLALDTISTKTDLEAVMTYKDYCANGKKIDTKKYKDKMLRFDLQFGEEEGESLDPKVVDKELDFFWWDEIDTRKKIVKTYYYFNADFIYDFIANCGDSSTNKLYINHVFAMKWPGTSGDSVCKRPKYEPYWTIDSIINGVSWSDKAKISEAMKKCLMLLGSINVLSLGKSVSSLIERLTGVLIFINTGITSGM